ncbi:MAG: HAMP domain-containing protein [Rhodocyclaceae bacterium]|nr:HAMP domain-containing protein [Rhodocyclaceae bacterium]MBK6908381.1 HAMP domain-containing protein [Rhodocyclaceae bacterium]
MSPTTHPSTRFLEPLIHLIGQISFQNKLRLTAAVFGLPLLAAAGAILYELNSKLDALEQEHAAIQVQLPTLSLLAAASQLAATRSGQESGVTGIDQLASRDAVRATGWLKDARSALTSLGGNIADSSLSRGLVEASEQGKLIETGSSDALAEWVAATATRLDELNESAGLLNDGDAQTSRLLDVLTIHLSGLMRTTATAARIGTETLVKQSLRGSRRNDLTLARGDYNALVTYSLENLRKVGQAHPPFAERLEATGGTLNTAYLSVQEMITTKMIDTMDFDLAPQRYLEITGKAFDDTLVAAKTVSETVDTLMASRLSSLYWQRNLVIVAMLAVGGLVLVAFLSAYISIMRGLHGLAAAVKTMADGDLGARINVTTRDELGTVGKQFNEMAARLAERTVQLREKTHEIEAMLANMPQGIFTITPSGQIHEEYSAYLETIFATGHIAGRDAMNFLFEFTDTAANDRDQVSASVSSCLGEDRMNFDFNEHLLLREIRRTLPDAAPQYLELAWSVICDDEDHVERVMVCVRDVTILRQIEAEAQQQRRELAIIGEILAVKQEKFHEFVASSRNFLEDNGILLRSAVAATPVLVKQLFRNMHTVKGNSRTYGLTQLTHRVHEAEQSYEVLRQDETANFDAELLLNQLAEVSSCLEEYAHINETKLGRRGPGRRGSAEKYLMVERDQIGQLLAECDRARGRAEQAPEALRVVSDALRLLGTERVDDMLSGVLDSLPSLAAELGKPAPQIVIEAKGIHVRNQMTDLLRNAFMHLYRNSLDHGLELPAERLAQGKPAAGCVLLRVTVESGRALFKLSDDGRGLALAYIRRKAVDKGLVADAGELDDAATAQLIFASGFSTAAAVTEVSGRGVGMDAVRDFIERESGSLHIEFTDQRVGSDYRAFETVISLPAHVVVTSTATEAAGPALATPVLTRAA